MKNGPTDREIKRARKRNERQKHPRPDASRRIKIGVRVIRDDVPLDEPPPPLALLMLFRGLDNAGHAPCR
jgi:hypothetical protein